jgi:hypothetical protein
LFYYLRILMSTCIQQREVNLIKNVNVYSVHSLFVIFWIHFLAEINFHVAGNDLQFLWRWCEKSSKIHTYFYRICFVCSVAVELVNHFFFTFSFVCCNFEQTVGLVFCQHNYP